MIVEQLGEGAPEIAVVGGIHGDEPCGVHAVETLLDEAPAVDRPVKFVIANERAVEQGVRYTETDLNRAFPGDPAASEYERRLAAALLDELAGCQVLALHSTQSTRTPFAIGGEIGPLIERIGPRLSIEAVVEAGCIETALGAHIDAIEVECGLQGTAQAAETAVGLVREFLRATGALAGPLDMSERSRPIFRLGPPLLKPPATEYTVCVPNFEEVAAGETYATCDEMALVAEESFYPVLLSSDGYEHQFGYTADLIDRLAPGGASIESGRAPVSEVGR